MDKQTRKSYKHTVSSCLSWAFTHRISRTIPVWGNSFIAKDARKQIMELLSTNAWLWFSLADQTWKENGISGRWKVFLKIFSYKKKKKANRKMHIKNMLVCSYPWNTGRLRWSAVFLAHIAQFHLFHCWFEKKIEMKQRKVSF